MKDCAFCSLVNQTDKEPCSKYVILNLAEYNNNTFL